MRKSTQSAAASTRSYKNLDVWTVAMDLAVALYRLAERLPSSERFEVSAQMRRAAVSVPSNIAEGHATGSDGVLLRHLRIARGSVGELETHLELALRLRLLSAEDVGRALEQLARTGKLLNGLFRSLRARRVARAGVVSVFWLICLGALAS